MKRFLRNVLLLAGIVLLLVYALPMAVVAPQFLGHYTAALNTKVERLRSVNEPKIILIGNSNLIYGMDSALLETLTGMPVVNMGFHGGMGNAFHERMARLNTNAGDIVIVSHLTYADDGKIQDANLIWPTLENHFSLYRLMRAQDLAPMANAYPKYLKDAFRCYVTGTGNRQSEWGLFRTSAFNEWGDIFVERTHQALDWTVKLPMPEINDTCTNRLNRLNRYVHKQGATLLVAGFPIYYQNEPGAKESLAAFDDALQAALDCAVISDFSEYLYPPELFYDTEFHLTSEGAEIRTRQLARDILAWRATQAEE